MIQRYKWTWRDGRYFVSEPNVGDCEMVMASDHEAEVRRLREALQKVRSGVLLMVPEPQKSGFIEIVDAALEEQ